MSRKRKNKHAAVPEEILAEGSAGTPVHVQSDEAGAELHVTAEPEPVEAVVIEEVAVEAAPAAAPPRKAKRRGKRAVEPEAVTSDEAIDAAAAHAEELEARALGHDEPAETADDREASPEADALAEIVADLADADGLAADAPGDAPAGEPGELSADAAEGDELVADGEEVAAVMPTSAASLDDKQLRHLVEALVFAADKPITVQRLRQLTRVADVRRLETALAELAVDYQDRGVILQQVSGGYQFRTQTKFSAWVQQLIQGRPVRLSRAQLETLAIVAYRQPITRPEIDDIRGVDSSATLKLLMDRALIRILGKREEVGRPMLYGTTKEFLDFFSLGDLRELPTLREYSELTDESRKVMKDRLGVTEPGGGGGEGGAPPSDGGEGGGAPPSDHGGGDEGGGEPASASGGEDARHAEAVDAETAPDGELEAAAETGAAAAAAAASETEAEAEAEAEAHAEGEVDAPAEIEAEIEVAGDAEAVVETAGEVHADAAAETAMEEHVALDATPESPAEVEADIEADIEPAAEPIYVVEAVDGDAGHWPQGAMRMAAVDPIIGLVPEADEPVVEDAHAVPEVLEGTGAAATREPTQE